MNVTFDPEEFSCLVNLVTGILDGPEQGVRTRKGVEKLESSLLCFLEHKGAVISCQRADYLRRLYKESENE
jgi:hypothetical protein